VSIGSQGELFSVLASGELDRLVGTEETDWLDFKKTAYRLDDVREKWELAKDVSAFANSRGGCIVMGVETRREQHQITDVATAIRPIKRVLVNPQRYLDVIDEWCFPHIEGVTPHWFPREGPDGLFVLEIPAQPDRSRYVLVTHSVGDDGRELNAMMITRRDGSRVVTLTPGEVHRLINDGLRSASALTQIKSEDDSRPDNEIEALVSAQHWEEMPVFFLQAIPSSTARLDRFYESEGVRGALTRHVPVRNHVAGFNLRVLGDVNVAEGAIEYLADSRRCIRIDPSGLFTFGALATSDYLAWGTSSWAEPGTREVWLNSIALVETTLEFYRFLAAEIMPSTPAGTTWTSRVVCQRFDEGLVHLRPGPPNANALPMINPPRASSGDWIQQVPVSGQPERDAFTALTEIYALFGLPKRDIPFVEGDSISLDRLRTL
jgi:Putative DNA-binding domain